MKVIEFVLLNTINNMIFDNLTDNKISGNNKDLYNKLEVFPHKTVLSMPIL